MSAKQDVLKLLEQHRGGYISGEELAKQLGVSRSAVWKSIEGLRRDGFMVEALTKKGYCLLESDDTLSEEGIWKHIKNKGVFDKIKIYKTVDSTNLAAKRLALEQPLFNMVVLAEEQTAGRGRMGRSFFSPASTGLYMSLLLHPDKLTAAQAVLTTTAASVAVCLAIEELTCLHPQIKWINDVYLKEKKICGILTEASSNFETNTLDYLVIGIGINFTTAQESYPAEMKERASSLFMEEKQHITRNQLAAAVVDHFIEIYEKLPEKEFIHIYRSRSCVLGKKINVIRGNETRLGMAVDIDENGYLLVAYEDGTTQLLDSGEISIRTI